MNFVVVVIVVGTAAIVVYMKCKVRSNGNGGKSPSAKPGRGEGGPDQRRPRIDGHLVRAFSDAVATFRRRHLPSAIRTEFYRRNQPYEVLERLESEYGAGGGIYVIELTDELRKVSRDLSVEELKKMRRTPDSGSPPLLQLQKAIEEELAAEAVKIVDSAAP